jgi:Domain of unknown function (DUF4214)
VTDDLRFLESAYARSLRRPIDPQSLHDGLRALALGESREHFMHRLEQSDEAAAAGAHTAKAGTPMTATRLLAIGPNRLFVDQAWLTICGRTPVADEVASAMRQIESFGTRRAWLRELLNDSSSRSAAAALTDAYLIELNESELCGHVRAELPRMMSVGNDAFVYLAYRRLLKRAPDPGARKAWRARLAAGERREYLLHELITSPEGRTHGASLDGIGPPPPTAWRISHRALRAMKRAWEHLARLSHATSSHR